MFPLKLHLHVPTQDTVAYPTASKEKERDRRNPLIAAGQEVKVKKMKFKVEDHYDDCGDVLSSLGPREQHTTLMVGLSAPYELESDEELVDPDYDRQMVKQLAYPTYPIDPTTVGCSTGLGSGHQAYDEETGGSGSTESVKALPAEAGGQTYNDGFAGRTETQAATQNAPTTGPTLTLAT